MRFKRFLSYVHLGSIAAVLTACPDDPANVADGSESSGESGDDGAPITTGQQLTTGVDDTADDDGPGGTSDGGAEDGETTAGSDDTPATDTGADDDCCTAHASASCNDQACANAVCKMDAACCAFEWDDSCAAAAADVCTVCGAPGTTSDDGGNDDQCCDPTPGVPGCANPVLEECVCGQDKYCCEMEWDAQCVGEAVDLCGASCMADPGDCCAGGDAPGCNDATCEADVCGVDQFCCAQQWDQFCAVEAAGICEICGGGVGDCCADNGSPGCEDPVCVEELCGYQQPSPECCTGDWNQACADTAAGLCEQCGGGPGDCCEEGLGAGCLDSECEAAVCEVDGFCCATQWDAACAAEAAGICSLCGAAGGDCCAANGTQGCDSPGCAVAVCGAGGADPTCCTDAWTQACADAASADCFVCAAGVGDCCTANGSPGCEDFDCQAALCSVDPFCCGQEWDEICANEAAGACIVCGGGTGDCCAPTGAPGCDDTECVNLVCGQGGFDPTCCTAEWTQACADAAAASCPVCTDPGGTGSGSGSGSDAGSGSDGGATTTDGGATSTTTGAASTGTD